MGQRTITWENESGKEFSCIDINNVLLLLFFFFFLLFFFYFLLWVEVCRWPPKETTSFCHVQWQGTISFCPHGTIVAPWCPKDLVMTRATRFQPCFFFCQLDLLHKNWCPKGCWFPGSCSTFQEKFGGSFSTPNFAGNSLSFIMFHR